jgi:methanogenic corrinoid protein MtbC1
MVAPAFLIVIVICVEFARLSILRNLAQNACYESCRMIMSEGASIEVGIARAQDILNRVGDVEADITINGADGSLDSDGNTIGQIDRNTLNVETEITIVLNENTVFLPGAMFGNQEIRAAMDMRTERYEGFFDAGTAH